MARIEGLLEADIITNLIARKNSNIYKIKSY